jgi:peptidoglycan-associated lipoprotein
VKSVILIGVRSNDFFNFRCFMKKLIFTVILAALLGACASSVKLDEPPVSTTTATPVEVRPSSGVGTGAVTPVEIARTTGDALNPAGPRVVFFDYDSFIIKPEYQSVVDNQARYLKADKGRKAMIEGHTDERGGREYNLALGQKRSEAVRRALTLLGVADSQIEAISYGKEKPATTGNDEDAYSKNRRAEIAYR